jgi:hypothetical protein
LIFGAKYYALYNKAPNMKKARPSRRKSPLSTDEPLAAPLATGRANLAQAQQLVYINSFPGNDKFLYTDKQGSYVPRVNATESKQREMLKKLINSKPKVTQDFIDMVERAFPEYLHYLGDLERATPQDIQASIASTNAKLVAYFPPSLNSTLGAEPTAGSAQPGQAQEPGAGQQPDIQTSMSSETSVDMPTFKPYAQQTVAVGEETENQNVLKAISEEVRIKNEKAANILKENLRAQKAGGLIMPLRTSIDEVQQTDTLLATRPEDPIDLEQRDAKDLIKSFLKNAETDSEQSDANSEISRISHVTGETEISVSESLLEQIMNSSDASFMPGLSEAAKKAEVKKLIEEVSHGSASQVHSQSASGVSSSAESDSASEQYSYNSELPSVHTASLGPMSSSSSSSGSYSGPMSSSGSSSGVETIVNVPEAPPSVIDAAENPAETLPNQQAAQNAGPAPLRPASDKVQYHKEAIEIFFGSVTLPNWDLKLESDIRKLTIGKEQVIKMLDPLIALRGPDLLVSERKSDGDIQELVEVLELHFCWQRLLALGPRAPMAMVPLGSLIKERNLIAGVPEPQTNVQGELATQPHSGPGDLGVFDVIDQQAAQAQAQPLAAQQVPGDTARFPISLPEAQEKVVEAWRSRKYVNGKPMTNSVTESMDKQFITQAIEKETPRPQAYDVCKLDPKIVPRNKLGILIRGMQRQKLSECPEY